MVRQEGLYARTALCIVENMNPRTTADAVEILRAVGRKEKVE
jgi:hypothetical protein